MFVDIETNGLSPVKGRVIEVAAIRVEQGVITQEFNQLINPGTPLPRFITNLTGITENDVADAPVFLNIAHELHNMLDGAIFVAHNVRFDYSFLKQEFSRVGLGFSPRLLCTVRLSRALYPEQKSHKLASLIERHGFSYAARHRAYDDAHILWQFLQHAHSSFDIETLHAAVSKQLKQPALPKGLDPSILADLPEGNGVYIFKDAANTPIYIGKSVNIRKRVLSHFTKDTEIASEFKISQTIKRIETVETASELEALLLESQLVKEKQPLYNKLLRRTDKLLIARLTYNDHGYAVVSLQEADTIVGEDTASVLAVYPRRSHARASLERLRKTYDICPKLLGLEKASSVCFSYQLKKCRGACGGHEPVETHNQRLLEAFADHRMQAWPFDGPVLIREKSQTVHSGIIVDQWCVLGKHEQQEGCDPVTTWAERGFDLDAYRILQSYMSNKREHIVITPFTLSANI